MIDKFNINRTLIDHIKIGRSTGAFPLFSFAISDYLSLCQFAGIELKYEDLIGTSVIACDTITEIDKWTTYRQLRRSKKPLGIFIVNVADQRIEVREDIIKNIIGSLREFLCDMIFKDKPYIALYSRFTYEDRLAFFIYDLTKFNDEDKIRLIQSIDNDVPEEFYVTNFDYNPDDNSITLKDAEEESDDTSAWVDVDDSEESDEESE